MRFSQPIAQISDLGGQRDRREFSPRGASLHFGFHQGATGRSADESGMSRGRTSARPEVRWTVRNFDRRSVQDAHPPKSTPAGHYFLRTAVQLGLVEQAGVHRAGVYFAVVTNGVIRVGDAVTVGP